MLTKDNQLDWSNLTSWISPDRPTQIFRMGDGPILAALRRAAGLEGNNRHPVGPITGTLYVTFGDFLLPQQVDDLTSFALSQEHAFYPSTVANSHAAPVISTEYRRSRVLYNIGVFRSIFLNRLLTVLNTVFMQLKIAPFAVTAIDVQLTATNDQEFFRPHTDNGGHHPLMHNRRISFTYFFHREPAPFRGGELCLYNSRSVCNMNSPALSTIKIAPQRNLIVFFPSDVLHEIAPVCCPSRRFSDSRFTLNGWIYEGHK